MVHFADVSLLGCLISQTVLFAGGSFPLPCPEAVRQTMAPSVRPCRACVRSSIYIAFVSSYIADGIPGSAYQRVSRGVITPTENDELPPRGGLREGLMDGPAGSR